MHRLTRPLRTALVALGGVLLAFGVAGLTQAASSGAEGSASTTGTTATTGTTTTPATTTTPKRPKPKKRQITCRARLRAQRVPTSDSENYGQVSCGSPLGKGVQHDTASVTHSSDTAGSFTGGKVKLFLNEGTLRGTYKLTFTIASGTVTYSGTMKISSGTGDFAHVSGSGTIRGTSGDGVRASMTEKLTLTFPAASG